MSYIAFGNVLEITGKNWPKKWLGNVYNYAEPTVCIIVFFGS